MVQLIVIGFSGLLLVVFGIKVMYYVGTQTLLVVIALWELLKRPHKRESWEFVYYGGIWIGVAIFFLAYLYYASDRTDVHFGVMILMLPCSWFISFAIGDLMDMEPIEGDLRKIGKKQKIKTMLTNQRNNE